jgi:hypothetical protein
MRAFKIRSQKFPGIFCAFFTISLHYFFIPPCEVRKFHRQQGVAVHVRDGMFLLVLPTLDVVLARTCTTHVPLQTGPLEKHLNLHGSKSRIDPVLLRCKPKIQDGSSKLQKLHCNRRTMCAGFACVWWSIWGKKCFHWFARSFQTNYKFGMSNNNVVWRCAP